MAAAHQEHIVRTLLREAGPTYAQEAGIKPADRPGHLFQLLVLSNLLSARIKASIAVAAARELYAAGGSTVKGMTELSWQQRVDALDRAGYVRYDESTSTRLEDMARQILDTYGGDLREMAERASHDSERLRGLLQEFSGIGPTGADIYCREAQHVWAWLRPYFDKVALDGAKKLRLPSSPDELARLVDGEEVARLASALTRVARDARLEERIKATLSER